ncbi:MAG: hypothetical protein WCO25_01180 [Candidatus Uhrbacteria bacterium]
MRATFDKAKVGERFAGYVPRGVAKDLVAQQEREPVSLEDRAKIALMFGGFLAVTVAERGVKPLIDAIVGGVSRPLRRQRVAEEQADLRCRQLAALWLKAMDEVRDIVDDPVPVVLAYDLMPDPAEVDDEICEASRSTIEMMYQYLTVDRIRTLYAAFVTTLRTEMADKAERIRISDTTVLAIDHGRFTLERSVPDSP